MITQNIISLCMPEQRWKQRKGSVLLLVTKVLALFPFIE